MSKATTLATAFLAARKYLSHCRSDGKDEFICIALETAHRSGKISESACDSAKGLISKRLNGNFTLYSWLTDQFRQSEKNAEFQRLDDIDRYTNDGRKMQATRLAWLNSLIKEFGGKV